VLVFVSSFQFDLLLLTSFFDASFIWHLQIGIPDVIGLLETDMARVFMGNRDLVEFLSETFHYHYSDYGPATRLSTWGCAVLSRYPILRADQIILPSPDGELACLVDVTIDINGHPIDFLVTHFGVWEDPLDRKLQSEALAELVKTTKQGVPTVFMGYITAPPYTHENYKKVLSTGLKDSLPQVWSEFNSLIYY
jgi:endonuclease/exonuclease/phosphatase family metal-dependent hydrolase